MELSRLKELISSTSSQNQDDIETLEEAKSAASDFDGIRSVVEDALGDLCDKLCKDGALADLMSECGADKLDTVKDKDGYNVCKKMDKLTKDYKAAIEKLLMEAETMVMQVAE